jgi:hypothetical protein
MTPADVISCFFVYKSPSTMANLKFKFTSSACSYEPHGRELGLLQICHCGLSSAPVCTHLENLNVQRKTVTPSVREKYKGRRNFHDSLHPLTIMISSTVPIQVEKITTLITSPMVLQRIASIFKLKFDTLNSPFPSSH